MGPYQAGEGAVVAGRALLCAGCKTARTREWPQSSDPGGSGRPGGGASGSNAARAESDALQ